MRWYDLLVWENGEPVYNDDDNSFIVRHRDGEYSVFESWQCDGGMYMGSHTIVAHARLDLPPRWEPMDAHVRARPPLFTDGGVRYYVRRLTPEERATWVPAVDAWVQVLTSDMTPLVVKVTSIQRETSGHIGVQAMTPRFPTSLFMFYHDECNPVDVLTETAS